MNWSIAPPSLDIPPLPSQSSASTPYEIMASIDDMNPYTQICVLSCLTFCTI